MGERTGQRRNKVPVPVVQAVMAPGEADILPKLPRRSTFRRRATFAIPVVLVAAFGSGCGSDGGRLMTNPPSPTSTPTSPAGAEAPPPTTGTTLVSGPRPTSAPTVVDSGGSPRTRPTAVGGVGNPPPVPTTPTVVATTDPPPAGTTGFVIVNPPRPTSTTLAPFVITNPPPPTGPGGAATQP